MITLTIYELAVILIYLSLRALVPELFVGSSKSTVKAAVPVRRKIRARARNAHYIHRMQNDDATRGAGMGMMMH